MTFPDLNFTLTPDMMFTSTTTARWDIIQDVSLTALSSDFTAKTGGDDFDSGDGIQNVSITISDDNLRQDGSFSPHVTEAATDEAETPIVLDHAIALIEDGTGLSFKDFILPTATQHETLVLASSHSVTGDPGDDVIIITKDQNLDLMIDARSGVNVVKFDEDVSITHVFVDVIRVDDLPYAVDYLRLTLGTGAEITVTAPVGGALQFQFGDGALMDYVGLVAAVTASGFKNDADGNATAELNTPIETTELASALNLGSRSSESTASTPDLNLGNRSPQFTVPDLADTDSVTDGSIFTLTPNSLLTGATDVQWDITPDARHIAALDDDFAVRTEQVRFLISEAAKGVSIAINDDSGPRDAPDAPVLGSVTAVGSVAENAVASPIGEITFTPSDVDADQGAFAPTNFKLTSNEDHSGLSPAQVDALNDQVEALFEVVALTGGAFGLQLKPEQQLNFEDKSSYAITVTVTDDSGLTAATDLTVNVTDVDEAPNISSGSTGDALTESDQVLASTVVYEARGAVDGGTITWSLEGGNAALFRIDGATGDVRFRADTRPNYEDAQSYTFTVVATSQTGLAARQAVSIAVTDIDDVEPDISSGGTGDALTENDLVLASAVVYEARGTADVGAITWSLDGADATLFRIDGSTGDVRFRADTTPNHEAKASYSFTVVATSSMAGLISRQAVTIQVTDVNEAPVLNAVTGATITDNASSDTGSTVAGSLTGSLSGTDVDAGDTLVFAASNAVGDTSKTGYDHRVDGTYGDLYYNESSGAYIFERDESAINALGATQNVNDTFTVSVSDGSLTSASRALVFTVNGANDAPVLNAVTGATITDNATSDSGSTVAGSLTGTLAGTDVDGDTLVFAASNATDDTSKRGYDHRVDGTYGNLYYNEGSGAYIFERDEAAINALDSGQNVNDTFTVSVGDGSLTSATRALVFNIVGANDAPTVGSYTGATITDNANSDTGSTVTTGSLTGTLVGSDADGDTLSYRILGTSVLQSDTSRTGYTSRIDGDYGQLYFNNTNGDYVFVRNETAINALDSGQTGDDTFSVSVLEDHAVGSGPDLVFNVIGANDAPVLNAVTGATITDNANSGTGSTVAGSLTGTLVGTDVDTGDAAGLTFAASNATDDTSKGGYDHRVDGTYGTFYYNEGSGAYIFERDEAAINALGATQNVNDSFTVSVSDGDLTSATRTLVFTVNGASDAPVLNAVTGATISDNATSDTGSTVTTGSLTGSLSGTDVDVGDTASLTFAASNATGDTSKGGYDHRVDGTYGNLYYNEGTGAYIFERDEAAINALDAGQNVNDTFTVSATDQHGVSSATRALVFTVNGANDAPILNAVTGATITDNATPTSTVTTGSLTGTLAGTDVDTGDAAGLTFAASSAVGDTSKNGYDHRVDGSYGKLYYNESSGAYEFERDEAAINALNATQNVNDSFTVSVSDGDLTSASRALVFTVVGANDAPILNAVTGATITDNAASDTGSTVTPGSLTGTLAGTDADTGDTASLTFAASNAVGDTSKGGYDHRVDGTYGNLYYNESSGAYIFERDEAAINALNATQNVNDTFSVSATDQHGTSSATRNLVFTVVGANDAPVLNAVTGATITDNATPSSTVTTGSLTGTLAGTDVDTGDAAGLTFAASSAVGDTSKTGYDHRVDGTYGNLYYNEGSGAYEFERDEAAINALNAGQNVNDTFTVSTTDQGGAESATRDLVFNVTGANDAPVQAANTATTINEGGMVTLAEANLRFTDADNTRAQVVYVITDVPDHGELRLSGTALTANATFTDAQISAVTYHHDGSENHTDDFSFRVENQDGSGTALTTASGGVSGVFTHRFTVSAVNDAPVLNAVTGATITDNATSDTGSTVAGSLTGTLTGTDADTGDTLTFAANGATDDTSKSGYDHSASGTYGKFYYNEGSGAYIFERDEAAINALGAGQNVNDTFTVSAVDQGGLTSATRDLVFSVVGANDAPVLNAVTGATITDNAASDTGSTVAGSLTGTLAGTDVDAGDAASLIFAASNATGDTSKGGYDHRVDGTYGDLYYNESSGAYIFERDEAAINALDAGQNVNDSFTVSVSDQGGLTSASRALVFTVNGANDAPVLNAVTGATITDNAASDTGSTVTTGSLTGTLAGTDVDVGDAASLTFAATGATGDTSKGGYTHSAGGTYGKLYYNEGSGAYIFERDEAAINALDAGDTGDDTFAVSAVDQDGASSATRDLVFTVNGANDAPVLSAVTGATITDNAASDTGSTVAGSLTGTLAGTDVDTGDTLVFAVSRATGDTSKSGYDHSVDGTYGKFYYNEGSGAYIFERDEAAINALDSGDTGDDSFTVSVSDGSLTSATRNLVFTVNGANDAPVLNAVTGATITDNAASDTGSTVTGSLTGTLAGTDVDTGDAAGLVFAASNATDDTSKGGYDHRVDGTYGTFYYNEGSGAYIFVRDEAAINALGATQNVNDTFTVSVSDGNLASATRALVFTVNGANDAPILSAVTGATITDNATPSSTVTTGSLTGTLAGTDVDTGDAAGLTFAVSSATGDTSKGGYTHSAGGSYGKLYYNESSGAYEFERDEAAINALNATQNVNDTFTVSTTDQGGASSATRTLVFTVVGANDAPVRSVNTATTLGEGATVMLDEANLRFTDVDNTRAQVVYVITEVPDHGELRLSGTALTANDTFTDADISSDAVTYHHDGSENHTDDFSFRVENQDGSGAALTTASGGVSGVFTHSFVITGANDAPVLNAVTGATITDNATSDTGSTVAGSLTGTLAGTDADGDTLTFAVNNATDDTSKGGYDHSASGTYGKLYYNESSGAYIFERDEAAINAVGATQNVNDTFVVRATDPGSASSAPRDLVFTVVGANDAPVLNAVTGATITDNAASDTGSTVAGSLTGTLVGTDADTGDTLVFAASGATDNTSKSGYDHSVDGTYGTFYYNEGSGAYIFERDEAAINALNATQNVNDSFTVSVSDQGGLTSASRALVFTVNGANDAPVLNAVTGATITDNANSDAGSTVAGSLTGTLAGTDADAGDTLVFAASGASGDTSKGGYDHSVDGTYGKFYYNEGSGAYEFERDEAAINALGAGQNVNDTFTVSVSDGTLASATRELVFSVVGADEANIAPVLNAVTGATITDNASSDTGSTVAGSLTGTLAGTDADAGDTLTFAANNATGDTSKGGYDHSVTGTYGKFYYNEGSGAYIFERDEAAINAVGDGSTVNDTFTVSATDQRGASSASRALVFTVVGANDAPVLNAVTGATITDNATSDTGSTVAGSLTGTLAGTDADAGDTLVFAASGATGATGDTSKGGYDHRVDGTYGDLYYNESSGAYIFERDEAAINALNAGQNVNDTFTVSVSDQGGASSASRALVFTVNGANDAPVLNAVTGATITDNLTPTSTVTLGSLTGTLAGNDVDGDTLVFAASGATGDTSKSGYDHSVDGSYGTFYYNEGTGAYIFERDEAAINAVGAGQNVNDTFTVSVSDGSLTSASRALVFNVVGADENNPPVLNAVTGATITDNANSDSGSTITTGSLTGTLTGTDADGDTLTFAASGATGDTSKTGYTHSAGGTYGTFYYNEGSGAYIFERDEAAINALAAGQNVNDTFTVSAVDQHGASSASRALVFTVVGADEASANNAPVLNAVTGATITDNANSDTGSTVAGSLTGTLAGTDVDAGDAASLTFAASGAAGDTSKSGYDHSVNGTYGKFYYNEGTGAYIFERDEAAINALNATQNVNDTFSVSAVDQHGASSTMRDLVFTVVGTNDQPILNQVTQPAMITDNANSDTGSTVAGGGVLSGTLSGRDVDAGDTQTYVATSSLTPTAVADTSQFSTHRVDGTYGSFYYHEDNGSYIFIRNEAAINALDAGQNVNDSFTVSVTDQRGQSNSQSVTQNIVFTVNGADDAPTLALATGESLTGTVTEDTTTNVGTVFDFGDVDTADAGANYSSLSFALLASSGYTSTATHVQASLPGQYGDFSFNYGTPGKVGITYNLLEGAGAVQELDQGDSVSEELTIVAQDADGNTTSPVTYTVTINGANDLPTLALATGSNAAPTVTEDATGDVSAVFDFGDVDADHGNGRLTIKVAKATSTASAPVAADIAAATDLNPSRITGEYGLFTLARANNTGKLTVSYNLNEAATNVQDLSQGDTVYDQVTIFVGDGTGDSAPQTFTVSITGADEVAPNNAPTGSISQTPNISTLDNTGETITISNSAITDADGFVKTTGTYRVYYSDQMHTSLAAFNAYTSSSKGSLAVTGTASSGNLQGVIALTSAMFEKHVYASYTYTDQATPAKSETVFTRLGYFDASDDAAAGTTLTDVITGTATNGTVSGVFESSSDTDYYTFAVTGSKMVTITETGTTANTVTLNLVDSTGTTLTTPGAAGTDSGDVTSISATLSAGNYTLAVGGGSGSTPVPYSFSFVEAAPPQAARFTVPDLKLTSTTNITETITGTSAAENIQGGAGRETITTGGGDDFIFGGGDFDTITLGDGADTVLYRFDTRDATPTNVGWVAIDGGDIIHNFRFGVDKLVFVDVSNKPSSRIDSFADFIADPPQAPGFEVAGTALGIDQVRISFAYASKENLGPGRLSGGLILEVNFDKSGSLLAYDPTKFGGPVLLDYSIVDDIFGGPGSFLVIEPTASELSGLTIL